MSLTPEAAEIKTPNMVIIYIYLSIFKHFTLYVLDKTKEWTPEESVKATAKGYMSLVDHALAKGEISVRQVGQSLEQDLGGHSSLEVCWVELVPPEI